MQSVKVSQLLDQQAMVHYQTQHGLQISHYHRWAEDLGSAIGQALLFQLSHLDSNSRYQIANGSLTKTFSYSVLLEVDFFNTVADDKVLNAGYFSFYNQRKELVFRQPYRIELALIGPDYDSMVNTLYQSLLPLAQQIDQALIALK